MDQKNLLRNFTDTFSLFNEQKSVEKEQILKDVVEHIDITQYNTIPMVDAMSKMAFQAKNMARAAAIYDKMVEDKNCTIILTLAGSLFSAGLKRIVYDMIRFKMVDVIVSTGANIVDQDFFEALGFRHYQGTPFVDDRSLRDIRVDRIYDTYIEEDSLGICDNTISEIADSLERRPYSSREFIWEMGKYLDEKGSEADDSVILAAYECGVPIFVPAFSDCSAGFGMLRHQWNNPDEQVSIDSAKDFLELSKIKFDSEETGIFMIGGGVPKNFTQDVTVAGEMIGLETSMHKYAVQITVADERDGALSGSTLKEACSWGKVDMVYEQMVFSEATIAMPIIAAYAYHKKNWEKREFKNHQKIFQK